MDIDLSVCKRRILFIADLHLSADRPKTSQAFFAFTKNEARNADALIILGDFFEFWVGDDLLKTTSPTAVLTQTVAQHLRNLAENGTQVFLMVGNRDFLLGKTFAQAAHATLIQDPTLINAHNQHFLVSHGDALCLDDEAYMQLRRIVRQPWLQKIFLTLPLSLRTRIARRLRQNSATTIHHSSLPAYLDVNPKAVAELLKNHHTNTMIHGHTHQGQIVQQGNLTRWVLPDWELDSPNPRYGWVNWDSTGISLHCLSELTVS